MGGSKRPTAYYYHGTEQRQTPTFLTGKMSHGEKVLEK
jgi:hypothetical protein